MRQFRQNMRFAQKPSVFRWAVRMHDFYGDGFSRPQFDGSVHGSHATRTCQGGNLEPLIDNRARLHQTFSSLHVHGRVVEFVVGAFDVSLRTRRIVQTQVCAAGEATSGKFLSFDRKTNPAFGAARAYRGVLAVTIKFDIGQRHAGHYILHRRRECHGRVDAASANARAIAALRNATLRQNAQSHDADHAAEESS